MSKGLGMDISAAMSEQCKVAIHGMADWIRATAAWV